jgi:2-haloalkanoic acid dehalogenase type II
MDFRRESSAGSGGSIEWISRVGRDTGLEWRGGEIDGGRVLVWGGMSECQGVLLDFYGTLVHEDDDVIKTICSEIWQRARMEGTPSDIGRVWWQAFVSRCETAVGVTFLTQRDLGLQTLSQTIDHFQADLDAEALIALQYAHWRRPPLFDDARGFLDALEEAGIPVCIVSNIDRDEVTEAMDSHGITIDRVITSEDVGAYKPRPEMFEAGLELLGMKRSEVLHIGDSFANDVVGAAGVGIPVAWLNRLQKPLPQPGVATYIVADLNQAESLVVHERRPVHCQHRTDATAL